jgi:hypothetical protein
MMAGVKYATAVSRLQSLAELAQDFWTRLADTDIGWPLDELWVAGCLLDGPDGLETTDVILMLDEPADDLPWMALHASGEWIGEQLRLTKLPIMWVYRPTVYPAWNARYSQVLRFWSARSGPDHEGIDTLRQRRFDLLRVVEATPAQMADQLEVELEGCRRHLHQVLDHYWDHDWRREHKGFGVHPEDHLWRAAEAVHEIEATLAAAHGRPN